MKKLYHLLIILLFSPIVVFAASTNFEPTYEMDTEIKDNLSYLMVSFEGDMIESINETIAFKTGSIELTNIEALNGYQITKKEISKKGRYTIINLSVEADADAYSKEYLILELKVNKTKYSDLFFYNIDGVNINSKFRNKGNILSLNKEDDLMVYTMKSIDSSTKTQYFFIDNMYIILTTCVVLIILLMIFVNLPSKNKKKSVDDSFFEEGENDKTFYNKDI